jgi:hypothetical protein
MITQEFLFSENAKDNLGEQDLDTTNFILSLFQTDDIDSSEAIAYLKNYISVTTPIEKLALKFIAYNFQYFVQTNDTITIDLDTDAVYYELLDHTTLGFYALLKAFLPPFTKDWKLKQVATYNPLDNTCQEANFWISESQQITLENDTCARMLAKIICEKFDQSITSLHKNLYKKLGKEDLAVFFDLDYYKELIGYKDHNGLKNILL